MKKVSTSSIMSDSNSNAERQLSGEVARPRRRTLDILRQFARCYHFDNKMPASLPGLVLN